MADCIPPNLWDIPGLAAYLACISSNILDSLGQQVRAVGTAVGNIASPIITTVDSDITAVESAVTSARDTVSGAVNAEVGKVTQAVTDAKNAITDFVTNHIGSTLSGIIQQVKDAAGSLTGSISAGIASTIQNVKDTAGTIVSDIAKAGSDAMGAIVQAATDVKKTLGAELSNIEGTLTSLMGGLVNMLSDKIDSLLSSLATVDDVTNGVLNAIRAKAPALAEALINIGGTAIGSGFISLLETLEGETPSATVKIANNLAGLAGMPPEVSELLHEIQPGAHPTNWFVLTILSALAIVPYVLAGGGPGQVRVAQTAYENFPVKAPDASTALTAYRRGIYDEPTFAKIMSMNGYDLANATTMAATTASLLPVGTLPTLNYRGKLDTLKYLTQMAHNGLSNTDALLILEATRPILTEGILRDAFVRGLISEPAHDAAMGALGYLPDAIATQKALYRFIPPAQDLTRMADKHVWDSGIGSQYGQFAEVPPEYTEFMDKLGYTADWTRRYWASHWNLPSPQQVFTMLHRGAITAADMNVYLSLTDWLPFFRDGLTKISYNVISRVDIRRLMAHGLLTDAEATAAYVKLGFTQEDATRLTQLARALVNDAIHPAIEPFRSPMRSHAVTAYTELVISRDELTSILQTLGYPAEQVAGFIAEADFVRTAQDALAVRNDVRRLFVAHLITQQEADTKLDAAGIGQAERDRLYSLWALDVEYRDLTVGEKAARELTKAEILSAYNERLISKDDAVAHLTSLRYHEREITILLELEDLKAVRAEQSALRASTKARYIRGMITRNAASLELDGMGLRHEHRDALLATWDADKIHATMPVPVGTIKHLVKIGAMHRARAEELLAGHNYPDDVVRELLADWGAQ